MKNSVNVIVEICDIKAKLRTSIRIGGLGRMAVLFPVFKESPTVLHSGCTSLHDPEGKTPRVGKWQPTSVFLPGGYHEQKSLTISVHGSQSQT